MGYFPLFCVFAVGVLVFHAETARIHVIEGEKAEPHSHPWMLSIGDLEGKHHCGASLLRSSCMEEESDVILTAAHCLPECWEQTDGTSTERVRTVKAGSHMQSEKEDGEVDRIITIAGCRIIFSESCNWDLDIAVAKLDRPIRFSETIQPIDLPRLGEAGGVIYSAESHRCKFAGWGYTETGNQSDALMELEVNPTSSFCKQVDERFDHTVLICAERMSASPSGSNGTACGYDAGSPLVCSSSLEGTGRMVQHGIVSGPPSEELPCGSPTVLVRVHYHVPWIEMHKEMICATQPTNPEM